MVASLIFGVFILVEATLKKLREHSGFNS